MRAGLIGLILGAVLAVLALFLVQRWLLTPVTRAPAYHFETCVLDDSDFPPGDLENGRLLRRALVPVRITTTFYDAQYREVTRAATPGRYGAVVRIEIAGHVSHSFITLYRAPTKIYWDYKPLRLATQLPDGLGIDSAVIRAQQREIGDLLQTGVIEQPGKVTEPLAILLAGLAETPANAPPAVARTNAIARDEAWWEGLRGRLGLLDHYPYLVDLPEGYDAGATKRWPLILFLADAGDRGTDPRALRHIGLAGLIAQGKQLPAIVVTPVCPVTAFWDPPELSRLLDEVCAKYPVDPDRINVTGISDGGDGTWNLGLLEPGRFAALAPICGNGDPADAARLVHVPVWAFHGMQDTSVPPWITTRMVDSIRQAGGSPHLTLFPDAGHTAAWDLAYGTGELYTWMFAQKRGQPEVAVAGVPLTPPVSDPGPTADHR